MKTTLALVGVLAMLSGCAAGVDAPQGDTNLSTAQGGTVGADPNSAQVAGPTAAAPSKSEGVLVDEVSVFNPEPQLIPSNTRNPFSPDPGPIHIGPEVRR